MSGHDVKCYGDCGVRTGVNCDVHFTCHVEHFCSFCEVRIIYLDIVLDILLDMLLSESNNSNTSIATMCHDGHFFCSAWTVMSQQHQVSFGQPLR